jgi:hypothetical protein
MEELYKLEGKILETSEGLVVEYDKFIGGDDILETVTLPIHNNQIEVAKKIIGEKIKFYVLACPDLQNGGEYEDFAIIEDPETKKRISAAMEALKGKKPFRSLNEHAKEALMNTDLGVLNKRVDVINEISVYVNEQIALGNIEKHEKSWLESVCIHWYDKGNKK